MSQRRVTIVLATNNKGKIAEFRALFSDLPIDLIAMSTAVPDMAPVTEDGTTFEANATKKAKAVAHASMMVTIADDSGLEVDAIHGQPGVRSSRYAGDRATDAENNAALLRALEEVPEEARDARFRCVVCLVDPWAPGGPSMVRVEGTCEGRIARSPRGAGGFGYDPLFIVKEHNRTMAELTEQEKNAVSHRARAARLLRPYLLDLIEEREVTSQRISSVSIPPSRI